MAKFIDAKIKNKEKKIRVNITVDKETLNKAKTKLHMFGGKLSTLFNAYLNDFVDSLDKNPSTNKLKEDKFKELEDRISKLEKRK